MMDKSFEYIEMCQKAEEIQKKWKPQAWDWVNGLRDGSRANYVLSGYETDGGYYGPYLTYPLTGDRAEIEGIEDSIWLPRQDQLQEMVRDKDTDDFALVELFFNFVWGEDSQPSQIGSPFTSMEGFWLAFVMKKKFGKVWQDGEWKALSPSEKPVKKA